MKISKVNGRFECTCTYDERLIPKEARFRWDPDKKKWWTDDMKKVIQLSKYADDELHKLIEGDVRKREDSLVQSHATDAKIDIPAPPGLNYFPFQKAGVAYSLARENTLIGDEMGCIDGEAIITINRGGGSKKVTLKNAFKRFNQLDAQNYNWDESIPTFTTSLSDGELRLNRIERILHKGKKKVLKIETLLGKTLRLTPDHEVKTPDGWTEAGNLKLGDTILSNGTQVCPSCKTTDNLITYKYSKFLGFCKKCMYRNMRKNTIEDGKYVDLDGYVRVSGCQDHHRAGRGGFVYEHILVMEAHLNRAIKPPEQIHHINGNRADNRVENLEVITVSLHHIKHSKHLNLGCFLPKEDQIIRVDEVAAAVDVYDIVMSDPHRNFVANGIIVHNCGKTIQVIGRINVDPRVKTVLVICPASLRLNWRNELRKWLTRKFSMSVWTGKESEMADIVVINYDILTKYHDILRSRTWDLLVCDECHYAKNPKALRTRHLLGGKNTELVKKLEADIRKATRDPQLLAEAVRDHKNAEKYIKPVPARFKMFLTGTPILNRPIELFPLLKAMKVITNWKHYVTRYCNGHETRYGWDVSGASNLGELQEMLRTSVMIRRKKSEVLTDLPAKMRQVVELPANGCAGVVKREQDAYREHELLLEQLRAAVEMAKTSEDPADYDTAVRELKEAADVAFGDMASVRHEVAVAKVPYVVENLRDALESGHKVVCFAHHKDVVADIMFEFPDISVQLTGDTKMEDRQAAVEKFQSDPDCRLFLGNIQAAGVGITLTAAHHVVFAELTFTPALLSQAEDRCHRIGQSESVSVQHLVLEGSLDARMASMLVEKQNVIDSALDSEISVPELPERVRGASADFSRDKLGEIAEKLTSSQIAAIHSALRLISSYCDGARSLDGMGFSKIDVRIGKELAARDSLSRRQAALGMKIATKYKRQYDESLFNQITGR